MTSFRKFSIVLLVVAALAGIMAAPAQALTLSCNQPATATVNLFYNMSCSATGGTVPYTYGVTTGSLPPGLNQFSAGNDLSIQGTPITAASYTFTLTATDSASNMASQVITIVVGAAGGSGTGTGTISLSSYSPTTLIAGNTTTLYVYGSNFTPNSVIHFNGNVFGTVYVNSTQLYSTVSGAYVFGASAPLYVSDPANGTSGTLNITISGSSGGSLSLSSISPTSAPVGSAAVTLNLYGSGFTAGSLVNFGSICSFATTFISTGQLQAVIPSNCLTAAQTVNVSVGGSNSVQFTIGGSGSSSGIIVLSSLSQTTFTPGSTVTVYFYGSNFTPNTVVHFNNYALAASYQSPTTLYATIPGSYITGGSIPVYLVDPTNGTSQTINVSGGSSGSSGILTLTQVTPQTGITPLIQTSLILYGTNFTGSSIVYFAGTQVQTQYGTTTELIATVPAYLLTSGTLPVYVYDPVNGTSGTLYVTVGSGTTGGGGITLTSLSPSSAGLNSGPVALTIFGSGFVAGSSPLLAFGNVCTVSTTYLGSTELTASIPNSCLQTAQTVNVTVGGSNALQFVIGSGSGSTGSLSVTCSPSTGPVTLNTYYSQTCYVSGGTSPYTWTVSNLPGGLTQSAYTGGSSVTISGTPTVSQSYAYTVQVIDNTSPNRLTGTLSVTGTVGSGNSTYNITSISPQTISVGSSSTNLSVFGTGFNSLSTVYFNGSPLSTTFVSSTQLYGLVPSTSLTTSQNASITVYTSGVYTNALTLVVGSGSTSGGTLSVTCTPGVGPQSVNTTYTSTCSATGGLQPYNWTAPGLPSYLTLSSSTGSSVTISGTPSSASTYNYTVRVSDSSSPVQTGALQVAGQVSSNVGNGGIVLTSLSPNSTAVNSAALTLSVFGSGFTTNAQIIFDGFPVTTTYISGGQLNATIPSGYLTFSRAAQVTVMIAGVGTSNALSFIIGTNVSNPVSFSCTPGVGPSSPNSYYSETCSVNGGTAPFNWTISAGAIPSGLTLTPNGVTATIGGYTTFNGPYSYTLQVTDSSSPTNTYAAVFAGTTGAGSGSTSGVSISSLSPNSVAPGSPAITITISGSGFVNGSTAYFNGTALQTTFVNSNTLNATIPNSLLTQATTATITVNSSGIVSNGFTFTVGTSTTTGITVSCSPDVGPTTTSSYSTTCTATGGKAPYNWSVVSGFLPQGLVLSNSNSSQVTISGLIFISGNQTTLPYSYTLQVTDSSTPTQTATFPFGGNLSVTAVGSISSIIPNTAPVGGAAFTMTVTGTGFQTGLSTVYWNGVSLPTSYNSSTQLSASVPAYLLATIGPANISVSTPGSGVTSQVSFFVSGASAITVSPSSLSFTYGLGGTLPLPKTLNISSNIALTGYSVTVSALSNNITWLSATPASSTIFPSTITISVAPGNLPIGTYNGSVTITGFGVGTGVVVPVSLTVTGQPTLVASPLSLSITGATGGIAPTQTVNITSSDGNTVFPYSVSAVANNGGSWLSVSPTTGSTPGSFTVTANASSLAVATYSGAITVTPTGSQGGNSLSIPVTFTVIGPTNLTASPSTLTFNGISGQSNPAAQTIAVSASGGSTTIGYTATATTASGGNWLSATASSSTTPGSISVTTNIANLANGTYNGTVTISASASNSPVTVPVTLVVGNPAPLTVSPTSITYNYQIGTGGPPTQTLNITGPNGSGTYNYTVTAATTNGGSWLSTSPTTGTTPGSVTVTANALNLQATTYNGTLTISAPGLGSTTVPVSLIVVPPAATLSVSPNTLTFSAPAGGSSPAAQTVAVTTTSGAAVNYTVTATSTGNWLSATATGTTPGSVSVSVNPGGLTVGQYTGSLSIASPGATNTPQTVQVTINVTPPPSVTAAPQSLSFFVPGDGSTPVPQSIAVISTGGNTNFTATATAQGGNWLKVSGGGPTPGSLTVTVNPAGLVPAQTYNGVVSISAPGSNPSTLQVPVTLTLAPQGAVPLQAAPSALFLSYTQGSGTDLQHVVVLNNGGGLVNYTVLGGPNGVALGAPPSTCGNWLNVITPSGTTSASSPGVVAFTVNPNGVNPQTCAGSIAINSSNGGQTVVPVYMAVSNGTQAVLLSQTAMNFVATSNGSAPAPQTFQILNPGSGSMAWSISTSTLSGGSWLSANPTSGNSLSLSQPGSPINVTVNPQGLAAGTYYGTVQVTSSGVPNSPQSITVSLTIEPTGTNPPAQVSPEGVILTVTNSSASTQMVNVTNSGASTLSYSTILATDDGQSWLTASPTSGSISAGSTNAITLSATTTNLGTGLHHGTLRLVFSDGSIQTVDVQLASFGTSSGTSIQACGASNLAMEFLSPQQNLIAAAQVAIPIQVLVQDCNGNTLTSSNTGVDLLVGSSNTDIRLNYTGNGIWAGTWTPSTATSATTLTARAIELVGTNVSSGSVSANVSVTAAMPNAPPSISAVVNAGSFMFPGLVAPGTMVSIFGSGLADGTVQVQSTPFPTTLQGAQFSIRGLPLPLFYASTGQVNAVLPIGLTSDVRDQLVVVRDATQSAPVDLLVADTTPGIFTVNSQGTGQAAALVNGTAQIAAPVGSIPGANAAPTTAGQTISIFLSGLGTVTNPPADGSPSTGTSLTTATPIVSIGGVPATVTYSGLAPGEVGLYQMNVIVPAGTMTGNAVPIFVSIGNENANFVTIAIQ